MEQVRWSFRSLTDEELLLQVKTLAASERSATVALVAALAELDERRLYLGEGYSSLFKYCTEALHLSGDAAYNRIRAARTAAKWPVVLDWLADGSLSLAAVRVLSDSLTNANHEQLLQAARHMSKRDVEILVAPLKPASQDIPPSVIEPVAEGVFYLKVAIFNETYEQLEQLKDLLRHKIPTGDLSAIVGEAISQLLRSVERDRWGRTDALRLARDASSTRRIPAFVRRAVWLRDGGQCAFVGRDVRCQERGFLEFHHVIPYAAGGPTTVDNIELRCRAHNRYEADIAFPPAEAPGEPAPYHTRTREVGARKSRSPDVTPNAP